MARRRTASTRFTLRRRRAFAALIRALGRHHGGLSALARASGVPPQKLFDYVACKRLELSVDTFTRLYRATPVSDRQRLERNVREPRAWSHAGGEIDWQAIGAESELSRLNGGKPLRFGPEHPLATRLEREALGRLLSSQAQLGLALIVLAQAYLPFSGEDQRRQESEIRERMRIWKRRDFVVACEQAKRNGGPLPLIDGIVPVTRAELQALQDLGWQGYWTPMGRGLAMVASRDPRMEKFRATPRPQGAAGSFLIAQLIAQMPFAWPRDLFTEVL